MILCVVLECSRMLDHRMSNEVCKTILLELVEVSMSSIYVRMLYVGHNLRKLNCMCTEITWFGYTESEASRYT